MKKYLAFFLAFCLMLAWIPPVSASGTNSGSCGSDVNWAFDAATETLTITGTGPMDDYRDIDTHLYRPWMDMRLQIRHVVVGDGITRLGHEAFEGLENLETVHLSDTVTEIGNFCFSFDSKLRELELPAGLRSISQQAFLGCESLTELHIPASVTFLDACAFDGCRSLRRVTFGSDPALPGFVIGNSPFLGCTALEEILVEEGHIFLRSIDGVLYTYDEYGLGLQQYPLGRRDNAYTIADGTYQIGQFSIQNPTYTECIIIPESVEYVGAFALDEGALKQICFRGNAPLLEPEALGISPKTVYYPVGNGTWTEEVMQSQHEALIWEPHTPSNPFLDVPPGAFYETPVLWALQEGITSGTSGYSFSPDGDCLRAQVVTFLWRAAGEPKPTGTHNPFVDVKPSDFYYTAVLWAVEQGITNGADDTHFNPMGVCNRAQVVTFLHRAFHSPATESGSNPFTDVPTGTWYTVPVLWAVEAGITNGVAADRFGPNSNCNRAQIVTFLHRAYTD